VYSAAAGSEIGVHRQPVEPAAPGHLLPYQGIDRHKAAVFQAYSYKADQAAQDRPPGWHGQRDGEVAVDHIRSVRELRRADQKVAEQRQQCPEQADFQRIFPFFLCSYNDIAHLVSLYLLLYITAQVFSSVCFKS